MSRKIIPYPCDYKNVSSVRRARRGGNVFVIVLCVLIALLLGVGAYFALADDCRALQNLRSLAERGVQCAPCETGRQNPTPVPDASGDQPTPTPTPAPVGKNEDLPAIEGSIGSVTAGGTNMREGPGTSYRIRSPLLSSR